MKFVHFHVRLGLLLVEVFLLYEMCEINTINAINRYEVMITF